MRITFKKSTGKHDVSGEARDAKGEWTSQHTDTSKKIGKVWLETKEGFKLGRHTIRRVRKIGGERRFELHTPGFVDVEHTRLDACKDVARRRDEQRLTKSAGKHDVSGEKRDAKGQWTERGQKEFDEDELNQAILGSLTDEEALAMINDPHLFTEKKRAIEAKSSRKVAETLRGYNLKGKRE